MKTKIKIIIDADSLTVIGEGYQGDSCLPDLENLLSALINKGVQLKIELVEKIASISQEEGQKSSQ